MFDFNFKYDNMVVSKDRKGNVQTMKTIVIATEKDGRTMILQQVMRGALSFGYVFDKFTKVFGTKKDAYETLKNHPCKTNNRFKYIVLNKTQIRCLNYLLSKDHGYIKLNDFLNLK